MELKGLYLNNIETAPPLGTWKDALNILVDSSGTAIRHEAGFLDDVTFEGNAVSAFYTPHGILIFTEKDGYSMIYLYYGENDIKLVLKDRCFNFRQHRLMDLAYVVNGEGDLIVAFTDGVESPKLVNITKADPSVELYGELSQKYELFPRITLPTISTISVIPGGRLPIGAYSIVIAGIDETHTLYNWSQLSQIVNIDIIDIDTLKPVADNGTTDNKRTNKAINLQISITSSLIKFFKIGFVINNNGVVKCYTSKEYIVSTAIMNINVLDTDDMDLAAMSDFINSKLAYKSVSNLATSNITKKLYISGLKRYTNYNYQPFANDIKIEWDLNKVVAVNRDSSDNSNYKYGSALIYDKGFMPNTICAFYIALILKGGGVYGVYHIPGREANPIDKTIIPKPFNISDRTSDDCLLDTEVMLYQTRDTCTLSSKTDVFGYGEMSYWENRDEKYPPDFPDSVSGKVLKDTPVRHHKFPSLGALMKFGFKPINYLEDLHNPVVSEVNLLFVNSITEYGIVMSQLTTIPKILKYRAKLAHTYELTINYAITITIPPNSIVNEVISVRFERRSVTNALLEYKYFVLISINETNTTYFDKVVYLTGSYTHTADIYSNETIIIYQGNDTGDFTYVPLKVISSNTLYSENDRFTVPIGLRVSNVKLPQELEGIIDGFQILYANPDLVDTNFVANSYAKQLAGIDNELYLQTHPIDIMASNPNIKPSYYTLEGVITVDTTTPPLKKIVITPTESSLGLTIGNKPGIICRIDKATIVPALNSILKNNINDYYRILSKSPKRYDEDKLYLISILNYRRNAYLDFTNKKLVSTGIVFPLSYSELESEEYVLNGGYAVMGDHVYNTYEGIDASPMQNNYDTVWSVFNPNFRTKGEGYIQDPWFYTTLLDTENQEYREQGNYYKFRTDTQLVTKYQEYEIYSPYRKYITDIKNMIAESEAFDTSGVTMNWRNFNPLSTYILPSLKGNIVALRVSGKLMYISCEKALFAASIKDVLQTESGNAFLTKGDFFDRPPVEIIPSDMGTIGNNSKAATQITTEGLVTVDRENAAIYLIGDSIKEITTPSVKDGFKSILKPTNPSFINNDDLNYIDEPSLRGGVSIADDPFNKRFIITINNSTWFDLKPTDTSIGDSDTLVMGACIISCKYFPKIELNIRKHFTIVLKDANNPIGIPIHVYARKQSSFIAGAITYDGRYNDIRDAAAMAESIKNGINTYLLANGLDESFQCYRRGLEVVIKPMLFSSSIEITNVYVNDTISYINIPNRVINRHIILYSYSYAFSYFVSRHKYSDGNYTIHSTRNGILKLVNLENSTNASLSNNKDKNIPDNQKSFIDFIFNMGGSNSARLQNVAFNATYSIENSVFNPANTYGVTSIALYTLNQCSGDIELTPNNIKQLHGFYYFNDIYDKLITQNIPFIIDGEFNKDILDGNEVSELIPNMLYITSDLNNGDYIQYNGKTYNMNGVVFRAVSGNTTFIASGSATVKTYKPWQTVSKIFSKVFVVRFTLANEGSTINTITNININFKPTRTTYAEIKNSGN